MRSHRFVLAVATLVVLLAGGGRADAQAPADRTQAPPDQIAVALASAAQGVQTAEQPATLIFTNRPIVEFRAIVLARTPSARASSAEALLDGLADRRSPGHISTRTYNEGIVVTVDDHPVFALFPADADSLSGETLPDKASTAAAALDVAFREALELRTPGTLVSGAAIALGATILYALAIWLLIKIDFKVTPTVTRAAERGLRRLPGGEIMVIARAPVFVRHVINTTGVIVGLLLTYVWLTVVLRRFPYTRPWGESLRSGLFSVAAMAGRAVVDELPNLLAVLGIVLITRIAVRLVNLSFEAVEHGSVHLPGVYAETAQPTRRIVVALLWVFALVMSYKYLPGSDSEAFKGISVFIGLVISLGSSGIMNQVMSGLMVTYLRALRLNDFVKIGEIEGTVTHLGSLSTKIKTARNEEITIPNAVVVSVATTNYSRFATQGVFAPTSVTIGYDTPWRQVHALLTLAAERTAGVRREPKPLVLQTALQDFYVQYTLLVSLEEPRRRFITLNTLHGHIQDAFNEYGVQIMSPNYEADPSGPKVVPPSRWHAAPASPEAVPAGTAAAGVQRGPLDQGPPSS